MATLEGKELTRLCYGERYYHNVLNYFVHRVLDDENANIFYRCRQKKKNL